LHLLYAVKGLYQINSGILGVKIWFIWLIKNWSWAALDVRKLRRILIFKLWININKNVFVSILRLAINPKKQKVCFICEVYRFKKILKARSLAEWRDGLENLNESLQQLSVDWGCRVPVRALVNNCGINCAFHFTDVVVISVLRSQHDCRSRSSSNLSQLGFCCMQKHIFLFTFSIVHIQSSGVWSTVKSLCILGYWEKGMKRIMENTFGDNSEQ
jgi:hypothetical protein